MSMPKLINPSKVLQRVADTLPASVKMNTVIVGSLAAAYGLFKGTSQIGLRTKDVDCALSPHITAAANARTIVSALLAAGWTFKNDANLLPGKPTDLLKDLPAARFSPPNESDWFLEFIAEPGQGPKADWQKFSLENGNTFALPHFDFTSIGIFAAEPTEFGIKCAKPSMMALANLLEHREYKNNLIGTTNDKRQNKDLGRAIAIGYITGPNSIRSWMQDWKKALDELYPDQAASMFESSSKGLERLIQNPEDLAQARDIAMRSILAGKTISLEQFRDFTQILVAEIKRAALH